MSPIGNKLTKIPDFMTLAKVVSFPRVTIRSEWC